MSFVDLATLAVHRRHDMQSRIDIFLGKCDQTIHRIKNLKDQAQGIIHQLNCDPVELKERYLKCVYALEDYTYLITEMDLALIGKLGGSSDTEFTPVQDMSAKCLQPTLPSQQPINLMDFLSEPAPSTSTACSNYCPAEKPKKKNSVPKAEQTLIIFSSASSSSESMPIKKEVADNTEDSPNDSHSQMKAEIQTEKEVQHNLSDELKEVNISDSDSMVACPENLPAQAILSQDMQYGATIISIDGSSFWIIVLDNFDVSLYKLVMDMTAYYAARKDISPLSVEEVEALTYCAYYDEDSEFWYRGLFLQYVQESNTVDVFLVDTGESRTGHVSTVRPLAAKFFAKPPYARCCHLAGVELMNFQEEELVARQDEYLRQYIGNPCTIRIEDNASESLGVSVKLSNGDSLEELLVQEGMAYRITVDEHAKPPATMFNTTPNPPQPTNGCPITTPNPLQPTDTSRPRHGPPEFASLTESEVQILGMEDPEYEDPLEAVMGYRNTDEAQICKHYKGGPEKSCFKGALCKKKHMLHNPDGWTLDQMSVVAKCPMLPLPAPRTWLRVHVTCVKHFDRLFVHLALDDDVVAEPPRFGVIRPPSSLEALVREMNSPAQRLEYQPFKIAPAAGELVAAIYPFDKQYYRARPLLGTPADHSVEVFYIDYGNTVSVHEDKLAALPERFAILPEQAMRCRLAGVEAKTSDSCQWAAATQALSKLVLEKTLDAHVVSRDYDEITVELYDKNGVSIAEELASQRMVKLCHYDFDEAEDSQLHRRVVP